MSEPWAESTEGDLDPDLTEEAGYAGWDPPERAWLQPALRALAAVVVVGIIVGMLLVFR